MLAQPTEPEAIATAYGLLWLVSIDNHQLDSRRAGAARKLLLSLLTKDGQRDGIERAKRMELDGLPVQSTEKDAAGEIERLEKLVYVPGQWRCPKCDFRLTQSNLYAATGAIGPRDEPGDKCPNCNGPLWRVSAMEDRNEAFKCANDMFDRSMLLHTALRTAVQHIEHMAAWIGKQNAGYSFESLGEDMPGIREAVKSHGAA